MTPLVPLSPDFTPQAVRERWNIRDVKGLPTCKIPGRLEPVNVDRGMIREGD